MSGLSALHPYISNPPAIGGGLAPLFQPPAPRPDPNAMVTRQVNLTLTMTNAQWDRYYREEIIPILIKHYRGFSQC